MRSLSLGLAVTGLVLFLSGVLSLLLTRQPTVLNQMATYTGFVLVIAGRAVQLAHRFASDVRGQSEAVKPRALTKAVPPAWAWGILGVILLAGIAAACWIRFFSA
jgi:hypothetical protein